jgi:hypothetical protein
LFTKGLTYCDEQTHSNRLSRGLPSRSLEGASENPVDASLDEFQLLRLAVDTVKLKHKASINQETCPRIVFSTPATRF